MRQLEARTERPYARGTVAELLTSTPTVAGVRPTAGATPGGRSAFRPLHGAARLAVRRSHAFLPLTAATLLVVATVPWQDDGHATSVVHGVVVLVALSLALSFDDPTGDVATAAAVSRHTWVAARLVAALEVALPVLVLGFAVARLRFPALPVAGLLAEAAGYLVAAVAVVAVLRAWRGTHVPSYLAGAGVLLVWFLTYALPRDWAMVDPQPWGPPYEAALWRWLGFVLVALAVLAVALRDPLDRARARS